MQQTWFQMKKLLSRLQLGQHRTQVGGVWQTGKISDELNNLMSTLKVEPPRYIQIETVNTQNA
jgi:hypothetical protein